MQSFDGQPSLDRTYGRQRALKDWKAYAMTRYLPRWRKATWALAIFTALMGAWIVSGVSSTSARPGLLVVIVWFIGCIALGIVWLMSRSKNNVLIHGPQGQQWSVSQREATRRLHQGWSYQPRVAEAIVPAAGTAA